MADKSKIEWTDASWTPIRARNKVTGKVGWHCEHVSSGCEHCYSETINVGRFGTGLPFKPGHRKDVEIFLDEKMLLAPLKWKKPRMIFVCSMTDLFAEFVPDEWIDRVSAVMAICPQHKFQVLTKRSKRMRDYMKSAASRIWEAADILACDQQWAEWQHDQAWENLHGGKENFALPLPNIWFGTSCEDQPRADERIPDLLNTPAAVRFVSLEPALGPIDFRSSSLAEKSHYVRNWLSGEIEYQPSFDNTLTVKNVETKLDWLIYGGESGHGHRPMQIEWAESIMRQCKNAGTAFFFKQDSGPRSGMRGRASDELWACKEFPKEDADDPATVA